MSGTVRIKRNKLHSIYRRHPWIFSGAVINKDKEVENGDIVRVESGDGKALGYGHYQKGSIMVRMLTFDDVQPDQSWWNESIAKAYQLRLKLDLGTDQNNAFRLIHGEGDGLPGLIIDLYDNNAVIQCHSLGMEKSLAQIKEAINQAIPEIKAIYVKAPNLKHHQESGDHYLQEGDHPVVIQENGVKFFIDWETGQKTGFFLDQRVNREHIRTFSEGKSVLNCFCYSGGFSIYALLGGAEKVTSVDISSQATDLVRKNHELNALPDDRHEIVTDNVMDYLSDDELPQYDIVVVDPPAFAKSKSKRHNAVQAYKRLNIMALKKVKPGGMLFTFSCSQVVDDVLFENTIRAAAIETLREVKVLRSLSQGPDHPVNIYHPEGHYLKGLILYVN